VGGGIIGGLGSSGGAGGGGVGGGNVGGIAGGCGGCGGGVGDKMWRSQADAETQATRRPYGMLVQQQCAASPQRLDCPQSKSVWFAVPPSAVLQLARHSPWQGSSWCSPLQSYAKQAIPSYWHECVHVLPGHEVTPRSGTPKVLRHAPLNPQVRWLSGHVHCRMPQSEQSLPDAHVANKEPLPPSLQTPSSAVGQELLHCSDIRLIRAVAFLRRPS